MTMFNDALRQSTIRTNATFKQPVTLLLLLVFLAAVLAVSLLALWQIHVSPIPHEARDVQGNAVTRLGLPLSYTRHSKRDCDIETVYAMDDTHCTEICYNGAQYASRNGICLNILVLTRSGNVANNCDPKRGLLAYMIGDPLLGRTDFTCLSIDMSIQPDDATLPNRLCGTGTEGPGKGGIVDGVIDYTSAFPQAENCRCVSNDEIPVLIPDTATIRRHIRCVHHTSGVLFRFVGLTL